ncbi:hypothetical protein Tco_1571147 [Tanacetum coccineum]
MVRSMMSQTTLPKSFWDYALETAARILNMVPTKKVEKTPYELFESNIIDQEASGSVEDLEIIQEEDTNPSLDTSFNHEEDDQKYVNLKVDSNPIREPANSKAALMDPKSKKWLAAMNVEMQSMKDNDVWELTLGRRGGESFWEGGDDFRVDVLHFHTCLTDILGFLKKLGWWFDQDIDKEEERFKGNKDGGEV